MIKSFYQDKIINLLGAAFTYGLNNLYSYEAIEEMLIRSKFIENFESNIFDKDLTLNKIIEDVYGIKETKEIDISFKGLFIGESYFKLFLSINKSFQYLFLYWPLAEFIEKYDIYHEMDFTSLKRDFILKTKEITLLKKLSQVRKIKLSEASDLLDISRNTIDKYARSDTNLYNASYSFIYKIARLFDVKENLFVSSLNVYLDKSYLFDDNLFKSYSSLIGLNYAKYFDKDLTSVLFKYNKKEGSFYLENKNKFVVFISTLKSLKEIEFDSLIDENTYLFLFIKLDFTNNTDFSFLKKLKAKEIYVLDNNDFYLIKKNKKKEITTYIDDSIIIKTEKEIAKLNEQN